MGFWFASDGSREETGVARTAATLPSHWMCVRPQSTFATTGAISEDRPHNRVSRLAEDTLRVLQIRPKMQQNISRFKTQIVYIWTSRPLQRPQIRKSGASTASL